ncbi:hypothetical protein Pta02_32130 [Planobispora takensis]|uniref:Uncharacterized protein n=1 Tax=Planobispora takensis TaxID=1367882 RepID=A0A8J3SXM0_9ACTN|nr:hypothetical protein Pta02_32130 [Planobispora takensis]
MDPRNGDGGMIARILAAVRAETTGVTGWTHGAETTDVINRIHGMGAA